MNTPGDTTCWTLIDGAAAGVDQDREDFARRYGQVVASYFELRWRFSPMRQFLEDACQEVFVECFRKAGPLSRADRSRSGGFRPFLRGVARNVAMRIESKREKDQAKLGLTEAGTGGIENDETRLTVAFDRAWAVAIMREAADLQRKIAGRNGAGAQKRVELLHLRFYEGLPIREIAARWETPAEQVHREYAKARKEFRSALMDVLRFHEPGTEEEVERECVQMLEIFE